MRTIVIVLVAVICAFPFVARAQINLVYNGSFEEIRLCPDNRQQLMYATNWHSLDTTWAADTSSHIHIPTDMPALFTTCGTYPSGSVPVNWNFNYHNARTGGSLVQLMVYRDTISLSPYGAREHAQGRLRQTLVAGRQYCVSFYISAEQCSSWTSNMIGAYLDDGTIDTVQWPRQGYIPSCRLVPQVYDTTIYTDTLHWHKIEGSFTATGLERFITIANFFDNAHTATQYLNIPTMYSPSGSGGLGEGSYLIDDVSVMAIDAVANAGRDTSISTEMSDSAWVGNHDGYVPCRWYTMSGVLIDSNKGGFMVKPTVTTRYIMELEVCGHVTRDTVIVFVGPSSIASPGPSHRGVTCYPNPAVSTVTVENAAGCEVSIYNAVGQKVASFVSMTNKETVDISVLAKGVYFVEIVDILTEEKVTKLLQVSPQ